jgi:hypothetical protein
MHYIVSSLTVLMLVEQSSYMVIKLATRSGSLLRKRQCRRTACGTAWKAFAMSTMVTPPGVRFYEGQGFSVEADAAVLGGEPRLPPGESDVSSMTQVNRRTSFDPMVIGLQLRTSFPAVGINMSYCRVRFAGSP